MKYTDTEQGTARVYLATRDMIRKIVAIHFYM